MNRLKNLLSKLTTYSRICVAFTCTLVLYVICILTPVSNVLGSDDSELLHQHSVTEKNTTNMLINNKSNPDLVRASGHFANNQIQDGIVTWIQGGFWNIAIDKLDNGNKPANSDNLTAKFDANFTMIKPDGSLSHQHIINNFQSDDVIFAGNDIIITGFVDIHSSNNVEYRHVPITIHLMGKQVLGLMIDVNQTKGHFSSSNEIFGTLISGIGLNRSNN